MAPFEITLRIRQVYKTGTNWLGSIASLMKICCVRVIPQDFQPLCTQVLHDMHTHLFEEGHPWVRASSSTSCLNGELLFVVEERHTGVK